MITKILEKRPCTIRSLSFPQRIDELVETTRRRLGLSRSRFINIAILEYLQRLGVLSTVAKEGGGGPVEPRRGFEAGGGE